MDASKSGEGQLEISINDGDVPNAIQVLGGGKCLVTYTPELPLTHEIEVTFNGEQVNGKVNIWAMCEYIFEMWNLLARLHGEFEIYFAVVRWNGVTLASNIFVAFYELVIVKILYMAFQNFW